MVRATTGRGTERRCASQVRARSLEPKEDKCIWNANGNLHKTVSFGSVGVRGRQFLAHLVHLAVTAVLLFRLLACAPRLNGIWHALHTSESQRRGGRNICRYGVSLARRFLMLQTVPGILDGS